MRGLLAESSQSLRQRGMAPGLLPWVGPCTSVAWHRVSCRGWGPAPAWHGTGSPAVGGALRQHSMAPGFLPRVGPFAASPCWRSAPDTHRAQACCPGVLGAGRGLDAVVCAVTANSWKIYKLCPGLTYEMRNKLRNTKYDIQKYEI